MGTLTFAPRRQGAVLLQELVVNRRTQQRFPDDPVPMDVVETALAVAAQAPSGYNLQPWRFLVLTEREQRDRLQHLASNEAKIIEAPVVVVAFAERDAWQDKVDEICATRAARTGEGAGGDFNDAKRAALAFVEQLDRAAWLHREVMIAFTYLLLAVESQGWDTAPMENFDADAVRAALDLPPDSEVVALLAIGRGAEPSPIHPGRLPVSEIAHRERYGTPLIPFNESES